MVKRAFLRIMSPAFSAPGLTGPVRCQACRGLGGGGPEALWSHVLLWIMAVRGPGWARPQRVTSRSGVRSGVYPGIGKDRKAQNLKFPG